ncbi:MAG: hypothetical protein FJX60_12705 [Alphaproteobacteria bacterium]|nr:hypothetical protein [Alphaproteobacteria bacterium]
MATNPTGLARFKPRKGMLPSFFLGLVIGPIALSYFGVTVTSRTARADLHIGTVELKAALCEVKARTAVADPSKLDFNARRELASKHAADANGNTDYEIVNLCSNKLG